MAVNINSLLHLRLSVPHYGVEVTTLVNLHLQQPQLEGGERDYLDYLACEVHPNSNGRSDIGGRSLVEVTETLEIVTDVTMMGLLISI